MAESEIKIEKRKISKSTIRTKKAEYPQYRISLPREFVEEHGAEVYLIADSIGILVPDEKILMKILAKFPEIRELALQEKRRTQK
jgi:hypothetical protein